MVRCKFTCIEVTKRQHWRDRSRFVYEASFTAVTDGSPENDSFFEATPSGTLKIGTYRDDIFQPGKDYYLDITEV